MEKVYPKLEQNMIPSAPLLDREFNDILDKEKMNSINDKIKAIQKDLNHYCKLKKRWKNFKTISKIISYSIFGITEVGTGVLIFIPVAGFIVPLIVTASGIIELAISEGLINNIIDKKRKNMDMKIIKCRGVLDKLYLFLEEAKIDRIIDSTELGIFNKIINEYYSGKDGEVKTDNNTEELKKLKGEIERLLKKK